MPTLRFGVSVQGTAVIIYARDAAAPIVVGAWSGLAAVGFLNWAAGLVFLPLQVVSIAGKVLFPALSQLQHNPQTFAEAAERALNRVATLLYPAALLLLAGADPIVRLLYGDPWVPAIPAMRLFCVTAILGGTSNFLLHALYSLGRADVVVRLMLLWAVLVWGLTLLMVPWLGFVGFAVASACLGSTSVLTARALRRLVPILIFPAVKVPLAAALASALLMGACASVAVYIGLACLLGGVSWRAPLLADWRTVWALKS